MASPSRRSLRVLEREIARLERERERMDRTIARLRQAAAFVKGSMAPEAQSLTSACRGVLRTTAGGASPVEVRDALSAHGFDWRAFSSPISAVHTVLKRLVRQGEATLRAGDDGVRRYHWRADFSGSVRTQAAEADRISHLLDGSISMPEYVEWLKRWTSAARSAPTMVVRRRS